MMPEELRTPKGSDVPVVGSEKLKMVDEAQFRAR